MLPSERLETDTVAVLGKQQFPLSVLLVEPCSPAARRAGLPDDAFSAQNADDRGACRGAAAGRAPPGDILVGSGANRSVSVELALPPRPAGSMPPSDDEAPAA